MNMKIERLIGIIIILLQNKKVTASYLAEMFEVSKRTIYRDITDLCLAGIPVITAIGNEGGIMIDEDYKIDKTLFTQTDLQAILAGLLGLDSITFDHRYQKIITKFFKSENHYIQHHILINLSSHYKNSLAPKIHDLQEAIEKHMIVKFDYYNAKGQKEKVIEPYIIVFQWSSWYLFGYELSSQEFKMYKLNRLWNIELTLNTFELRDIPQKELEFDLYFTDEIHAVILFDHSVKYKLIEEYGMDCFKSWDNESVIFEFNFTNKEYLLEWVMSFGDKAELIEPQELRVELKTRMKKVLLKYEEY